jgi:hypothetical protein
MVAALEIAASLVGWLAVFGWALSGPRLGRGRTRLGRADPRLGRADPRLGRADPGLGGRDLGGGGRRGRLGMQPPTITPAVMALIAGLHAADQFKVTLLDLGRRGWFRLTAAGSRAVCVLPVEAPVEELTPYEHSAVHHLAKRAGTHAQLPADAVADGYEGGESHFLSSFRKNVIAEARTCGLTRPTLSAKRKLLLCLLALIPAAAPLLVGIVHHVRGIEGAISICIFYYLALCVFVVGVTSERLTSYGAATLKTLREYPPPGRVSAAALGHDLALLAPFTSPGKNRAWSGYGENWRMVRVGDAAPRVWPGMTSRAARTLWVISLPGTCVITLVVTLAGHSFGTGLLIALGLDAAVFFAVTARWMHLPRRAEFEGQILRQWDITVDEDGDPTSCRVAIDDGTSEQAWALTVSSTNLATLAPGATVRAIVNPRLNKVISIEAVRNPQGAPQLLNPAPDPRAGA